MAIRIYVGNLPYTVDDRQLSRIFSVFGIVIEAHVARDNENGRSKGFAFVQLTNDVAARRAITELNGVLLETRTLLVTAAHPRTNDEARFGDPQMYYGRSQRW